MAKEELSLDQLAKEIYKGAGGMENVETVNHCMTRVRMSVVDRDKVNKEELQNIPGVMGVVDDEQLQVIIGPGKVNKVAKAMVAQAGVNLGEAIPHGGKANLDAKTAEMKAAQKAKQKQSPIKAVLKDISNIFVPMIPAFVGAGIVAGIASVLTNSVAAGNLDAATWNYYINILNILKNGMFMFLSIYTGINAAQVFGATPTLGGVIGAISSLPGANADVPITNIFTGQPVTAGQGGIIGVIFAVWLLSIIERKLHDVVWEPVDIIVTPTIALLTVGLLEVFLIMPLAGFVSNALVGTINGVLDIGGAFSGFVLGAAFLPMVMFGLHQILTPIHLQMIESVGNTPLLPILAMAGAGQVGAALALWVRLRKNKELTEMIKGALPVGILGIGEPLIYAVTLPLGRPFITACIGGGIGGAVVAALGGVGATAIGPSGAALIPLIVTGKQLSYILGLLAGYAGGFVATYFFGIPKEKLQEEKLAEMPGKAKVVAASEATPATSTAIAGGISEFYAVADGVLRPIAESSDPVFSQKMMGDGYFVTPKNGQIFAPVAGVVSSIFPTKHAIGITTETGLEVLLHMGVDTVQLEGKPFEVLVQEGAKVTPETQVANVDLAAIKVAGKGIDMLVLVTNMDHVAMNILDKIGEVTAKTAVMKVETK